MEYAPLDLSACVIASAMGRQLCVRTTSASSVKLLVIVVITDPNNARQTTVASAVVGSQECREQVGNVGNVRPLSIAVMIKCARQAQVYASAKLDSVEFLARM